MISINRYICVAAAAVYGGYARITARQGSNPQQSIELTARKESTPNEANALSAQGDSRESKPNNVIETLAKQRADHKPEENEIGDIARQVLDWEEMTFGNLSWGATKAVKGSGFALTDGERGTVGSAFFLRSSCSPVTISMILTAN